MRISTLLSGILGSLGAVSGCGGNAVVFVPTERGAQPELPADAATPNISVRDGAAHDAAPDAPADAGVDAACTTPPRLSSSGVGCGDTYYHACGIPAGIRIDAALTAEDCNKVCDTATTGRKYWGCGYHQADDVPRPSFDCYTCVEGRRPAGYDAPSEVPSTVGAWFAHAADVERVSIDAFRIMARELCFHGAPGDLVTRALDATRDEIRHARTMAAFARREGASRLAEMPIAHGPERALVEMVLENAVEGCIRETFGALVAGYQAKRADRMDIRRAMQAIYADETRHAELAWDTHAWFWDRLSVEEQSRVREAMQRALMELAASVRIAPGPDVRGPLGLPDGACAQRLLQALETRLFGSMLAA